MKPFAAFLLAAALATALAAPSVAGDQQTFWTESTGTGPSPWPTPTSWPVDWYGQLYYPLNWPYCGSNAPRHCRPHNGHVWPPKTPPGRYPVPMPKNPRPPR